MNNYSYFVSKMGDFIPAIHPWNQAAWQSLNAETDRANHALLFTGDAGLGKQDLAVALAHSVLTRDKRQSSTLFDAANHPDFHVIIPENKIQDNLIGQFAERYKEAHTGKKPKRAITIEQIRQLSQALTTHPHISSHRVVLMFYAETMNRNAANALLKSLEEPPANTLFIVVSDELSKLAKTIRSRCSLVNFKPPDYDMAEQWLKQEGSIPEAEIKPHLSMANNHPLQAVRLYQSDYLAALKSVVTDVNSLWTRRSEVTQVAKNWQAVGGSRVIDILQKLTTDLLRCRLSSDPKTVFFPIQKTWVASTSQKLSKTRLLLVIDELTYSKKMLATTVDELLVLETLSAKLQSLPQ